MILFRSLVAVGVLTLALSLNATAQQQEEVPSIDFGGAQVSLGMSREEVEENLAKNGLTLEFIRERIIAIVVTKSPSAPRRTEGNVSFSGDYVVSALFHFPEAHSAGELAQEISGAVDKMDTKVCTIANYGAHGTASGPTQTVLHCGRKFLSVMSGEASGDNQRHTEVDVTIGGVVRLE